MGRGGALAQLLGRGKQIRKRGEVDSRIIYVLGDEAFRKKICEQLFKTLKERKDILYSLLNISYPIIIVSEKYLQKVIERNNLTSIKPSVDKYVHPSKVLIEMAEKLRKENYGVLRTGDNPVGLEYLFDLLGIKYAFHESYDYALIVPIKDPKYISNALEIMYEGIKEKLSKT